MSWKNHMTCAGVTAALAGALLALPAVGYASLITVVNASFEAPTLSDGSTASNISGWTVTAGQTSTVNPSTSMFATEAPDGLNVGKLNRGASMRQVTTATVEAFKTYTLTVSIGDSAAQNFSGVGTVSLWAVSSSSDTAEGTGTLLASLTPSSSPANGQWTLATLTYNSPSGVGADINGVLGKFVKVQLKAGGLASSSATYYDNVVLTVVPEPASLALFAVGGVLMLGRRRR